MFFKNKIDQLALVVSLLGGASFNDKTQHKISLYSDDEDSYIILDDVYYTYYNSNKDGLIWKQ